MIHENEINCHRFSRMVVLIFGGLSTLFGTIVLLGWHFNSEIMVRVLPSTNPMPYNTALCFVLCGIGLLSISFQYRIPTRISGGVVAAVGFFSLCFYMLSTTPIVDFMPRFPSIPGIIRMAPNTALCFILTGLGIGLMGYEQQFKRWPLFCGVLGSLIVALAAVAFLGYSTGVEAAYTWGNMPGMPLQTTMGFFLLGTGIFGCGWYEGTQEDGGVPSWLAFPAGIAITAIALFQWQALIAQEKGAAEMRYPLEKSPLPLVILAAGILMALMLTLTIHLAQKLWSRAKIMEQTNRNLEQEIHERERMELELRQSEEKYRLLATNTLDCIWCMNLDFKFTYINPSVMPMFGFTPEQWTHTWLRDHCNESESKYIQDVINNELADTKNHTGMSIETFFMHRDGHQVAVEINGKLLMDPDGNPVEIQGTIRDITERKAAAEEKQELEDLLRQSQKLESLGTLAGGIAHDFNNILGVMMGYAELSLDEISGESNVKQNLRHIMDSSKRAREMVKQILAFSRKSEVVRVPVYLNQITNETLTLLRSMIPTSIEIRSLIQEKTSPVLADSTQIHQVIMNLCTNASQAMRDKGGLLEVTLKTVNLDANARGLHLHPGLYQMIAVSDNGHGMDEETRKRIFEPYFTTKTVGEGTGMGLAVVHGIVKEHGGEITVRSRPGMGATFELYFPVLKSPEDSQPKPTPAKTVEGGDEKILLVDDEQVLAEMEAIMLTRLGYNVTSRIGSVEALEAFRASPKKFDIVVTDQTMPNMSGVQLAKAIKRIRPDIPVVLCTGFSENISEDNFEALGIDAFVLKPIVKKHIAPVIRKVLDQKK